MPPPDSPSIPERDLLGEGSLDQIAFPVVQSDVLTENTGIVGGFADWCQLLERRGILVEVGFTDTQFVEGKQTIRASLRTVFAIYRAAAFCTVTGI